MSYVCHDGAVVFDVTDVVLFDDLRARRDAALAQTDWLVIRHRDEADASLSTTLSSAEYAELLAYRQSLRDLPDNTTDPANPSWPTPPAFL